MVKKYLFILGFIFLFSLSFCLAKGAAPKGDLNLFENISLGDFTLPGSGQNMPIEDIIVFLALFIILFAIILEIFTIINFPENKILRVVLSLVIVLIANYNGFLLRVVEVLKDTANFTNWLASLTWVNWVIFVVGLVVLVGVVILFKSLITQWKADAVKEEEEIEEIENKERKKLKAIRNKYARL